ncbi:hypothetical protein LWF01_02760 [Saxibacter everestensis]|uniref:Uncharacterized protein n=1 Tax=Saxibacter everestensis TaxID=2909229 RepID=A0ABY8QUK7_9MICO|nr:hypothetical protein LWF01_02760 [Brevibacteriaceae bacterium ZFBP1038]
MSDCYDKQGRPITLQQWVESTDDKRVARDKVGFADVSTVWLGLDHNHFGGPKPIIFETMIGGGRHNLGCWRYSTLKEAQAGHERVVRALRAGEQP